MTVKELLFELAAMPKDAEVVFPAGEEGQVEIQAVRLMESLNLVVLE